MNHDLISDIRCTNTHSSTVLNNGANYQTKEELCDRKGSHYKVVKSKEAVHNHSIQQHVHTSLWDRRLKGAEMQRLCGIVLNVGQCKKGKLKFRYPQHL